MRILVGLIVVAGVLSVSSAPACACTCYPLSPLEQAAMADVIFTGRAVEQRNSGGLFTMPGPVDTRFAVERSHKGEVPPEIVVQGGRDAGICGVSYDLGEQYTVFARSQDGVLTTTICSGTKRGTIDGESYGLSTIPLTPGPTAQQQERGGEAIVTWGGVVLFGLALLAGLRSGRAEKLLAGLSLTALAITAVLAVARSSAWAALLALALMLLAASLVARFASSHRRRELWFLALLGIALVVVGLTATPLYALGWVALAAAGALAIVPYAARRIRMRGGG